MSLHLFAGLRVRDFEAARPWYERLTYSNGVRKAHYRDPDGNELAFGGAPLDEPSSGAG